MHCWGEPAGFSTQMTRRPPILLDLRTAISRPTQANNFDTNPLAIIYPRLGVFFFSSVPTDLLTCLNGEIIRFKMTHLGSCFRLSGKISGAVNRQRVNFMTIELFLLSRYLGFLHSYCIHVRCTAKISHWVISVGNNGQWWYFIYKGKRSPVAV